MCNIRKTKTKKMGQTYLNHKTFLRFGDMKYWRDKGGKKKIKVRTYLFGFHRSIWWVGNLFGGLVHDLALGLAIKYLEKFVIRTGHNVTVEAKTSKVKIIYRKRYGEYKNKLTYQCRLLSIRICQIYNHFQIVSIALSANIRAHGMSQPV